MTTGEEFEVLKKDYILKTLAHLKALEKLEVTDFKDNVVKGELAIRQSEIATSFMTLCKCILKL